MNQLLIVDDEIPAVRGLRDGVDWKKLDIAAVHTAYNIRQAQEIFRNHRIDVMICDIDMPQGTGLELLEWVREQQLETETIFLTCYAEFEYARKAVQLDSFAYLLKPVNSEELESVVLKALEKVKKEREIDDYCRLYELNKSLIAEHFWLDLLQYRTFADERAVTEMLEKQNLPYTAAMPCTPILISIRHWHRSFSPWDIKLIEYALRNAARETFGRQPERDMVVQLDENAMFGVFFGDDDPGAKEWLKNRCETYVEFCSRHFYCDVCCLIGERVAVANVQKALEALQDLERNSITDRAVLTLKDHPKPAGPAKSAHTAPLTVWAELLKQGSKEKLLSEVYACLETLWSAGADVRTMHEFFQDFMQMIFHVLQVKGFRAHQVFEDGLNPQQVGSALRSRQSTMRFFEQIVEHTVSRIRMEENKQSAIQKAKLFIELNLHDESLSRETIASHVYVHPDYLTKLFRKETGMSVSEYLLKQRIQLANELLTKTDMPIGEIAAKVGFGSFYYFSRLFKKVMNMNPQEYRKKHADMTSRSSG